MSTAPVMASGENGVDGVTTRKGVYSSNSPFYSRWTSNGDEECQFMFKSKNHFIQNAEKLRKFFASGILCDVVLKCGELEMPCHRLVLAASSDYFAAMFTGGMAETRQNEVTVNGVDPTALKLLVNFCYTGEISLTDSGVESLLSGACLLQLNEVIEACSDYLRHQLHPSNCLGIRNFADAQGCRRLHDSAHTFTTDHFMDVIQQNEYLLLPVDDLFKLLSSDELNVTCETVVFRALAQWIEHDPVGRRPYVGRLMAAVRLPFLSADFIADNIENNELFRQDSVCKELITQAYKYHLLPDRRRSTPECRPRKSTIGSLYVIGGNDATKGALTIESYNCIKNRWSVVGSISSRRLQFGVAVLENKIFVVGGREGLKALNTFEFWDSETGSWTQMPAMNTPRHGLGVTVLENVVYAVGGHDGWSYLSSAERWDANSKTWSYISEMTSPRSGAGVVSLDGKIYVVGGRDGSQCLRSVECYSPHTNKWTHCAPMSKKRGSVGVGVLHNCIYAVGGLESPSSNGTAASPRYACVERYDPKTDSWCSVANLSVGRDGVAVSALGDQLYAVGGYSGHHYLPLVECFDCRTNEWTKAASLCNGRASACLALVSFHQRHSSLDTCASSSSLNSIS